MAQLLQSSHLIMYVLQTLVKIVISISKEVTLFTNIQWVKLLPIFIKLKMALAIKIRNHPKRRRNQRMLNPILI